MPFASHILPLRVAAIDRRLLCPAPSRTRADATDPLASGGPGRHGGGRCVALDSLRPVRPERREIVFTQASGNGHIVETCHPPRRLPQLGANIPLMLQGHLVKRAAATLPSVPLHDGKLCAPLNEQTMRGSDSSFRSASRSAVIPALRKRSSSTTATGSRSGPRRSHFNASSGCLSPCTGSNRVFGTREATTARQHRLRLPGPLAERQYTASGSRAASRRVRPRAGAPRSTFRPAYERIGQRPSPAMKRSTRIDMRCVSTRDRHRAAAAAPQQAFASRRSRRAGKPGPSIPRKPSEPAGNSGF